MTHSPEHFLENPTLLGAFLSPPLSGGTRLSTFLSTQTSALIFKSPFLSGSTLASALLGTFWRALGPPEPTSIKKGVDIIDTQQSMAEYIHLETKDIQSMLEQL